MSFLFPHNGSIASSQDVPPNFVPYAKGFLPTSPAHNSHTDLSTQIYGISTTTGGNQALTQSGPSLVTNALKSQTRSPNNPIL